MVDGFSLSFVFGDVMCFRYLEDLYRRLKLKFEGLRKNVHEKVLSTPPPSKILATPL